MNEKGEQAAREISETREKAQNFRVFRIFRVLLVLFETWVKAQPQKPVASANLKHTKIYGFFACFEIFFHPLTRSPAHPLTRPAPRG
jgi:hypothetical protein